MSKEEQPPVKTSAVNFVEHQSTTVSKDLQAPNPQGKGQIGFLKDWHESSPRGVVAKPPGRILADYFTSLLVLSAEFKFKPAADTPYFLYRDSPRWMLSLISPMEWGSTDKRASFVGTCVLHADSTWSIEPGDNLSEAGPVAEAVGQFYASFAEKLRNKKPLEDGLPIYEAGLPYYQRLYAAALSRSLKGSMLQGGQLAQESLLWMNALPADAKPMMLAFGQRLPGVGEE